MNTKVRRGKTQALKSESAKLTNAVAFKSSRTTSRARQSPGEDITIDALPEEVSRSALQRRPVGFEV